MFGKLLQAYRSGTPSFILGNGANRKRLLIIQTLEDRRCLAANPVTPVDLSQLEVDPASYEPSSLIVRYRSDGVVRDETSGIYGPTRTVDSIPLGFGLEKVELAPGVSVHSMLDVYRRDPQVLYAEPNYHVRIATIPNDARFDDQWDLNNTGQTGGTADADIDAPEAWDALTGTGSTIVAVIDTGVDYLHPDLAPNMWTNDGEVPGDGIDNDNNGYIDDVHGYDFFNSDGDPLDDNNHGTHVAGTIGAEANNGVGIAGINWDAQIMAVKFLGANGSGSTSDAISAVRYAIDNGAHISNNSWGGDPYSQALYDVIQDARDANHIFVAAAGNGNFFGIGVDNDATPFYPASYDLDNIVAVAATDHNDAAAIFSNYGQTSVDIGAPGVDILSTNINGSYGYSSGTSMAAPHVTGALSLVRDSDPTLDYLQVIDRVLVSADPVDSMQGITVTGGRLNVAASLIPDTVGPQFADVSPSGLWLESFSSLQITFNEPVAAGTFTTEDIIHFSGPEGDISPLSLNPIAGTSDRQFELTFPLQSTAGDYELVVSPDILDRFGNAVDSNENGIGGEFPGDELTHSFVKADAVGRFDFGTATSPVATNYTRVTQGDRYDTGTGYGWQSGAVYSLERVGDPLTADFNYTRDATFAVDVPNGEYDVIVTLGETIVAHDEMGVFLEGVQVDTVSTAAGEFAVNTYRTTVTDGQLNLGVRDLGGTDLWVMLNGLDVIFAGPDLTGPKVLSTNATGTISGPLDRISLSLSEGIQEGSLTLEDIAVLEGPEGAITPIAVQQLAPAEFEVTFEPQNVSGEYSLVVGPDIADLAGNLMDQDGDGIGGEPLEDRFETTFTLEAGPEFVAGYDFGTTYSAVAPDYTRVTPGDLYSQSSGYGWSSGAVYALSRGGDPLTQDVNYTRDATFAVDLPNGEYDVTVTVGEALIPHDQMGIFLEGVQVDSVTTAAYEFAANTYRISISDGQLELGLRDLGGSDPWVMINALDILFVGPDLNGPSVASTDVNGTVTGPIDRITLSFSEPIQPGSFSLEDILALEGPGGAITPSALNQLSPGEFEVTFDPQNSSGEYSLVLGPDIADIAGNLMDQDGDGTGGESVDDQFELTFTIEAGPEYIARIDFGTTWSPVAEGYTRVTSSDRYDAAAGHGWLSGSVYSLSWGGDPLTRDLNYTRDATFAWDLPNGDYEVTVTMGEALIPHDQMGVFLEGNQVDSIATAAYEFVTHTYATQVVDGQLSLGLRDLGGSNIWVVINGLEIARVAGQTQGSAASVDAKPDWAPLARGLEFSPRESIHDQPLDHWRRLIPRIPRKLVSKAPAPIRDSVSARMHDQVITELWSRKSAEIDSAVSDAWQALSARFTGR